MAVRTTASLVGGIIEVDDTIIVTASLLDPFMQAANLLINRLLVPAKKSDGTPFFTDETELQTIETWLAAHFYAVRDPRIQFDGVKSLMTRYESHVGLNLNNTRYGQAAMTLDASGALAEFNRTLAKGPIKRRVGVWWLGLEPDNSDV